MARSFTNRPRSSGIAQQLATGFRCCGSASLYCWAPCPVCGTPARQPEIRAPSRCRQAGKSGAGLMATSNAPAAGYGTADLIACVRAFHQRAVLSTAMMSRVLSSTPQKECEQMMTFARGRVRLRMASRRSCSRWPCPARATLAGVTIQGASISVKRPSLLGYTCRRDSKGLFRAAGSGTEHFGPAKDAVLRAEGKLRRQGGC